MTEATKEKLLKILKKFYIGVIICLSVLGCCGIIGMIIGLNETNYTLELNDILQISAIFFACVILLLLAFLVFYFGIGSLSKCRKCKGKFCVKYISYEVVKKEQISIKKFLDNYDRAGNVIGTSETYIPGTRYTDKNKYRCKKCGDITYKYTKRDCENT